MLYLQDIAPCTFELVWYHATRCLGSQITEHENDFKSAQHHRNMSRQTGTNSNMARLWTYIASTRQDRNLVALLECVHLRCLSKIEGWTVGGS